MEIIIIILSIFLAFATLTQGQPLLSAFFAETEVDTFNYLLDIYPNASAAYSLRSLKSNYTGGLVEIRRSSDNARNTFYADSNNTLSLFSKDISNTRLSTWVGSNDGFVSIWYDQSGNGVNVGNSTQSNQPQIINSGVINTLNYKSSIYFDGDKKLTKAGFLGSNANTLLILMNQTNVSGKSITTDGVDIGIRNTASNQFKIKGTNYTMSSACATSGHCIGNSMELIQMGKQDVVFAGGSEEVHWAMTAMFDAMTALSSKYNDTPETASRAYDKTRDGFVIAGGGGVLVLEEYEHAKARGAKIYAEVAGGGLSADAHHLTAPHPEGLGAKNVMLNCLKDAGVTLEEVDAINVHGTSTPLGDVAETKAIKDVFGEHAYNINTLYLKYFSKFMFF